MKPPASLDDDELDAALRGGLQMQDAPAPLLAAVIELWPHSAPAAVTADASIASVVGGVVGSAMRRVQAVLSFDSWASTPGALGLRSTATSAQSRHLMFDAGERTIDLRIAAATGSYVLAGQILGPEERGSIELCVDTSSARDDARTRTVELDDFGSFELAAVRAGTYAMTVRLASGVIELPPVTVGER